MNLIFRNFERKTIELQAEQQPQEQLELLKPMFPPFFSLWQLRTDLTVSTQLDEAE